MSPDPGSRLIDDQIFTVKTFFQIDECNIFLLRHPQRTSKLLEKPPTIKGLYYTEYESFCPVVWVGPPTSSPASECVFPGPGGGGGPIQTTWQKRSNFIQYNPCSPSPLRKNIIYVFITFFVGHLCVPKSVSGVRIQVRICIHRPDRTGSNPDPKHWASYRHVVKLESDKQKAVKYDNFTEN